MSSVLVHPFEIAAAPSAPTLVRLEPAFYPSLAIEVPVAPGLVRADGRHQLACVLGLPVPIGVFEHGSGPAAGLVSVSLSRLPFEVGLADWCRFRCVQAGWCVSSAAFVDTPHGRRFELVASRDTVLGPMQRRDLAWLEGGWLVQINALAGRDAWSASRSTWATMAEHTAWAGGRDVRGCEARTHVVVPGTSLSFEVPASWAVAPASRAGAADVELRSEPRGLAWIHLRARSSEAEVSVRERGRQLLDALAQRGFAVGRRVELDRPGNDVHLGELGFEAGWVRDATGDGGAHDVRLWHRRVGAYDVDALLLAPPPGIRQLVWMRAIRAFELAFASTSPSDVHRG